MYGLDDTTEIGALICIHDTPMIYIGKHSIEHVRNAVIANDPYIDALIKISTRFATHAYVLYEPTGCIIPLPV